MRFATGMAALALVGLVSCTQAPLDVSLLRNATAPVASQVDVRATDLSGTWFMRQRDGRGALIAQSKLEIEANGSALAIAPPPPTCDEFGLCSAGAGIEGPLLYLPQAGGRWASADANLSGLVGYPSELWVYWMDFDRRTAAIGNPNGNFVAILDRNPRGGGDRITAARDILEWFGYDLAGLVEVSP